MIDGVRVERYLRVPGMGAPAVGATDSDSLVFLQRVSLPAKLPGCQPT